MRPAARPPTIAVAIPFLLTAPFASTSSIPSLAARTSPNEDASLAKRADSTTYPAARSLGPSQYWDGNDGPWTSFPLQLGNTNNPQNIRVFPSTAIGTTISISANGCPKYYPSDCADVRGFIFKANESLTWVANSMYNVGIEQNLGMDTQGPTGFDTVTLGWQGSTIGTVNHSVVFNLADSQYWLGLLGLKPQPSNFTTFNDPQPSIMQDLVNHNITPSLTYGYTAGNQYRLNKVYGSLTFGGYDSNRFDASKNITVKMGSDITRDLLVNLQGIKTSSGSPSNLLPGGSINILIDSSVAQIWLPKSACTAFEEAFGLTWDPDYNFYLVNNSLHESLTASNPKVTFTIGSQASGGDTVDITLPYGAFDLLLGFPNVLNLNSSYKSGNESYYFPLKRAANDTQYILGRTFLQEAYIIADYDSSNFTVAPCIWDDSKVSTTSLRTIRRANETSSDSDDSSTPVGAIAGGVVGGVVGAVAIIGAILYFMRRRKQTEKKRLAELEAKDAQGAAKTSEDPSNENKPFVSQPINGELGGGEIHELAPAKIPQAQEMDSPYKVDPNRHGYSEMQGSHEAFAPKDGPSEMHGSTPIYEMAGSDVHEMPTRTNTG
ncbi:uncharacterized protein MYCFIDRAFT_148442 [Pseudocercospora fijiensis CIRAD86]|uniref:Peptidase A1 domain-containing protein n=1 Tax=Pseudocercospora fijiensis (strain CIRAD86) TaxID=383855 RepID=N1Q7Y4_PSEFD|nr:uncharacterized protein MYCFIDRAFT_148442 [Pseudocercospora fijiensis CIRAD86]EME87831.1 hypothetical protein MYCFIDRAFT_148442 [Pseudocercospora fijiensis CIRAD86]